MKSHQRRKAKDESLEGKLPPGWTHGLDSLHGLDSPHKTWIAFMGWTALTKLGLDSSHGLDSLHGLDSPHKTWAG